jgi:hypothetical protein
MCPTRLGGAACATLVKPGGWVFFSTINRNPKAFLLAIVGAEYVLNLLPRGTHEYAKLIRPANWRPLPRCRAGPAGHPRHGIQPAHARYWLSSDTSVNYLFATRKAAVGPEAMFGDVHAVLFDLDGTLIDSARPRCCRRQDAHRPGPAFPALERYRPWQALGRAACWAWLWHDARAPGL